MRLEKILEACVDFRGFNRLAEALAVKGRGEGVNTHYYYILAKLCDTGKVIKPLEEAFSMDPGLAIRYAMYTLKDRWEMGEHSILQMDTEDLLVYIKMCVKERWPAAEPKLLGPDLRSCLVCMEYAVDILEAPFPECEPNLFKLLEDLPSSSDIWNWWDPYIRLYTKTGWKRFEDFLEERFKKGKYYWLMRSLKGYFTIVKKPIPWLEKLMNQHDPQWYVDNMEAFCQEWNRYIQTVYPNEAEKIIRKWWGED